MNTENAQIALLSIVLGISASSGAVADAVKKGIFHGHGVDWRQLATLAEAVRVNAAMLALLAEREADEGLSSVTLGPADGDA
jgi:hypothetical protein